MVLENVFNMEDRIGIIGGSGLEELLRPADHGHVVEIDTPFGRPAAPPILGDWDGVPVAILSRHGTGHLLNPTQIPYRANIYALKAVGCRWIIASGAVGSLNEAMKPRDLVLVDQAIDRTVRRTGTFFENTAVHVEFAEPVCPVLRQIIMKTGQRNLPSLKVHDRGTYLCMEGPAFSTRAESILHRSWGADLIGMTLMPEAKLAREAEISYAAIALVTDYDCWRPHQAETGKLQLLEEIISHLRAATANAMALIRAAIPRVWARRHEEFPAHRALELAIWSDKTRISAETRQTLDLLWGRYFLSQQNNNPT